MRRYHEHCGFPVHHLRCIGFMTVEKEVEMLEKAKKSLNSQLAKVNEKLEKLKEQPI